MSAATVEGIRRRIHTQAMKLSVGQIVEETRHWPEDAIADLLDRISSATYGDADPAVERAWCKETQRRPAELEGGQVQGLEEALARARALIGR